MTLTRRGGGSPAPPLPSAPARLPGVPRDWQNLEVVGVIWDDAPISGHGDPAPAKGGRAGKSRECGIFCLQSLGWPPQTPGLDSKGSRCPAPRTQADGVEGLSCDGALGVTRVTALLVYLMAALAVASAYLASWAPTPLPTSSFLSQYLVFTPLHSPS